MRKKKISLDQFIEGANKDKEAKKARKRTSSEKILLSATGKVENRDSCTKMLFYITPDIEDDINTYCSGTKQAIISYLIRRGLDELIKDKKVIVHEIN